jgi:hypothetical protein
LTQSIKEIAASRCSKGDIIEFMEEFLKLRKENLQRQVDERQHQRQTHGGRTVVGGATDDEAASAAEDKCGADERARKAEEERQWIDQFLSRLESEKTAPKRDVMTPPPEDDDDDDDDDKFDSVSPQRSKPLEEGLQVSTTKEEELAQAEASVAPPLEVGSRRRGLMVSGIRRDRGDAIGQTKKGGSYRGPPPPHSPSSMSDDSRSRSSLSHVRGYAPLLLGYAASASSHWQCSDHTRAIASNVVAERRMAGHDPDRAQQAPCAGRAWKQPILSRQQYTQAAAAAKGCGRLSRRRTTTTTLLLPSDPVAAVHVALVVHWSLRCEVASSTILCLVIGE